MRFKVIFLDIDGVLNCGRWIKKLQGGFDNPINQMEPAAVTRLNRITDITGAKIVVSSTWRIAFLNRTADPLLSIRGCMKSYGITGEVIGMTPRFGMRGDEIQAWLAETDYLVEKFVVIDDDTADMGEMKKHQVKTVFEDGLTDEITDLLIERLGRNNE